MAERLQSRNRIIIYLGGDLIGDDATEDGNGNTAQNNGGGIYFYRSIGSMGGSTGILHP